MCNLLTVKIKPLSRIPYQRGRVGKRDREREREKEREEGGGKLDLARKQEKQREA
jgi:hypothetical protein